MQSINLSPHIHSENTAVTKKPYKQRKLSKEEASVDALFAKSAYPSPPTTPKKSLLAPIATADSPTTAAYKSIVNKNPTPEKESRLKKDDKGKIRIDISPNSKKASNLIYRFKNSSTGKVLVGKTETKLSSRLSGYTSSFNNIKAPGGNLKLPVDVRKDPENFTFGILKKCSKEEGIDLGKLEDTYIVHKKAIEHGYNSRRGGAGARKRQDLTAKDIRNLKDMVPDLIRQESPADIGRFFRKADGTIGVDIDSTLKKTENVVYAITEERKENESVESTITKPKKKRYIGKSEPRFGKRISTHLHFVNHPENPKADTPLYRGINKSPGRFKIDIRKKVEEAKLLEPVEAILIKTHNSFEDGFNRNRGCIDLVEKHEIIPED